MNVVKNDNLEAPELAPYARLTEAQLRNRLHPEEGLFICESMKVIRVALASGVEPVSFLCEEKFLPQVEAVLSEQCLVASDATQLYGSHELNTNHYTLNTNLPVYTADREVLCRLTGYELSRGVLCCMRRPTLPSVEALLKGEKDIRRQGVQEVQGVQDNSSSRGIVLNSLNSLNSLSPKKTLSPFTSHLSPSRVAVLDGVVNSENTGAIFRGAAALGIDAVLLTRTCCDPLNRRACRVSMGTVFQLPWTFLDNYMQLKDCGFEVVALALTDRSVPIGDPSLRDIQRMAIVLGTEGDGLGDEVLRLADHVARIPMHRGVDSLNVAAAAAVAFYQLAQ